MALKGIKALTFDVGGSIFDWQTATRTAIRELAAARSAEIDVKAFAFAWRRRNVHGSQKSVHGS